MNELLRSLKAIVGESHVLTGEQLSSRASHYWDATPMQGLALIRPGTTQEVSQVLKLCNEHQQTVVTQGGLTGLAGGERSDANDIILSLERMQQIESVDASNRSMVVDAGVRLETVQQAAAEHNLQFGLDLGARGSCTIGGNISTNAGGLSVLRYGMMREQVLGLEAVLADGTIVSSMNSMMKNNTGYDLKQLFIGSEGTLGVVTRAVLRLRPPTPSVNTAMVAFENFSQVQQMLSWVSETLNAQLNAFEIMWRPYYALNTDSRIAGSVNSVLSADYPIYATIESRGSHQRNDAELFTHCLEQALNEGFIVDAVIAQSEQQGKEIWAVRENVDLTIDVHACAFVYDISLPIKHMQSYLDSLEATLRTQWSEVALYAYGHLADGNLHLVIGPTLNADADETKAHENCDKLVLEPLQALGGSISAEHGIGTMKKMHLGLSRSEDEIKLMERLKLAMDPQNILNPDKIVSV